MSYIVISRYIFNFKDQGLLFNIWNPAIGLDSTGPAKSMDAADMTRRGVSRLLPPGEGIERVPKFGELAKKSLHTPNVFPRTPTVNTYFNSLSALHCDAI